MKKYLFIALIAMLGFSAQAQVGKKEVGLKPGYAFDFERILIGADFRYNIMDPIRVSGSFSYYPKKDYVKGFGIDIDGHYLFPLQQGFQFYPLVGLNYTSMQVKYNGTFSTEYEGHKWTHEVDVKDRTTRVGVNLGLGLEYSVTPVVTAGAELKYLAIKDMDQIFLSLRVGYSF